MRFSVGDIVRCIESSSEGSLNVEEGNIYTITGLSGLGCIKVDCGDFGFYEGRFVLHKTQGLYGNKPDWY